jgi:aminoglycoside phosphotransferase (APT) family kinase protein
MNGIIQSSGMIILINYNASIADIIGDTTLNMHSLTKTPISQQTAQSIFSRHFGASSLISTFHELKDGFYNSAFFVELMDGKRWVLKVAPNPSIKIMQYEKRILRTEVDVLRLVKSNTDLPVPFVAANDYAQNIIENDYFIMEFIDGIPLNKLRDSLSENEAHAIDERTGYFLRQMNLIEGKRFGIYSQPEMTSTNWREAFTLMLRSVLEDGQREGVILPVDYNSIQSQIFEHLSCLEEVQTPRLVHWDLWYGNIFVDPVSKQITGLIDFERALWADPLMEANFGAFGINPSFLKGYGEGMLVTPIQKKRRVLYNIYLYLIMVIECYFRKYETDQQENWARQKLTTELEILNFY